MEIVNYAHSDLWILIPIALLWLYFTVRTLYIFSICFTIARSDKKMSLVRSLFFAIMETIGTWSFI